jgi:hypothetical protein
LRETPSPRGRAGQPRAVRLLAGDRGIEPRWPVLETSVIPDRLLRFWVPARYRSGTFAFTARCAGPLHHGHHLWSGWLDLPQRPPVPETGAHLPELHPDVLPSGIEPAPPGLQPGAITRSATGASLLAGLASGQRILGYSIVKDLQTNWFGDEESNLDRQGQSLPACHWPIPEHWFFRTRHGAPPYESRCSRLGLTMDPRKRKRPPRFPWAAWRRTIDSFAASRPTGPSARDPGCVEFGSSSADFSGRRNRPQTNTRSASQRRLASRRELCGECSTRLCEGELGQLVRQENFLPFSNHVC